MNWKMTMNAIHSPICIYIWSPSRAAAERTEDIHRYVYIYLVPISSSCREDGRHSPVRIYIWSPSRAAAERTEDIHRYVYISGLHHEQQPRGRKTFTDMYIYLVSITSSSREDGRHSPIRIYIWSPSRAAAERTEDIHRYVYISGPHHEQLPRGRKTFTGTYIYLVSITSSCREDGRHSPVRIYIWSPSRAAAERTEDIHRYVYISGLHHEQLPRGRKTFTDTYIYLVFITSSCREDGRHSYIKLNVYHVGYICWFVFFSRDSMSHTTPETVTVMDCSLMIMRQLRHFVQSCHSSFSRGNKYKREPGYRHM